MRKGVNAVGVFSNMFTHLLIWVRLSLWGRRHFTELDVGLAYLPKGPELDERRTGPRRGLGPNIFAPTSRHVATGSAVTPSR